MVGIVEILGYAEDVWEIEFIKFVVSIDSVVFNTITIFIIDSVVISLPLDQGKIFRCANSGDVAGKLRLCQLNIFSISFVFRSIRTNVSGESNHFFDWWWWLWILVFFFLCLFGLFSRSSGGSFFLSSNLPWIYAWLVIFPKSHMARKLSILSVMNVFNCNTKYHLSKPIEFFLSFMNVILNAISVFVNNSSWLIL